MSRGPEPGEARLRRLLAMLPFVMERGEVTVAELAERFDASPDRIVAELEMAACCGLPPYTDELIDLWIDQDVVHAGVPRIFDQPLRPTAREAFALVVAAEALLAVPGADPHGPLARGVAKLQAALEQGDVVVVDLGQPWCLRDLRAAVEAHERVEVTYWSAWRDATTTRLVDPWATYTAHGRWYLDGYCHAAGARRRFRVDRIDELRPTGEHFDPVPVDPPVEAGLAPGSDTRTVVLRLPAAARWVTEAYALTAVEALDGGGLRVTLEVAGRRWLERLLLRVGPEAVVESPEDLAGVGRDAAGRLLQRYR